MGWVRAIDKQSQSGTSTNSSQTVEVSSLRALDVTATIPYGYVLAGQSTGSSNQTTTVTNVGNTAIDIELSGANMCTDYPTCAVNTISVSSQEYSLSAFSWGSGTDLQTSTSSINMDLSKPTSHPSTSTDDVYWGMGVPTNSKSGAYSGVNTFVETAAQ
jgi:hypothetical protein